MSRTLLLIRHSKALQEGASDFVRELAPRGLRDAAAAGAWLHVEGLFPDLALVSPATRAVQTWEAMSAGAGMACPIENDARIYHGAAAELLEVIRGASEDYARVALVGHNPTMHELACDLDDADGDAASHAEIARAYPTSGIAVFTVVGPWASLVSGAATLRSFVVPRA